MLRLVCVVIDHVLGLTRYNNQQLLLGPHELCSIIDPCFLFLSCCFCIRADIGQSSSMDRLARLAFIFPGLIQQLLLCEHSNIEPHIELEQREREYYDTSEDSCCCCCARLCINILFLAWLLRFCFLFTSFICLIDTRRVMFSLANSSGHLFMMIYISPTQFVGAHWITLGAVPGCS